MAYALSTTMVIPALPQIQRTLHASGAAMAWVVSAAFVSAAVFTAIVGRLGDMYGKQRILVFTLAVMTAGSLVSGLAHSVGPLIAGRVLQGLGGGVYPLAFGVLRDELPRHRLAAALGAMSATLGIGTGIGPLVGGLLVDQLGYPWVFWLPLGLSAVAAVAGAVRIPRSPDRARASLDWGGAVLLTAGLTAPLIAISQSNRWGWGSARVIELLLVGAALLTLLVLYELRRSDPLVDMRVLGRRVVLTTNGVGFFLSMGAYGPIVAVALYSQEPRSGVGFGLNATAAGLLILPQGLAIVLAGPIAGRWGQRRGSWQPLLAAGVLLAAPNALLAAFFDVRWFVYPAMFAMGMGTGFLLAASVYLVVESVPPDQTSTATGISTIIRSIGAAVAAQLVVTVTSGRLIAGTALYARSGFVIAFALVTGLSLVGTFLALTVATRPRAAARARRR
jgi:MFS family permease